jgi:hypothetical protein
MGDGVIVCVFDGVGVPVGFETLCFVLVGKTTGTVVFVTWMGTEIVCVIVCVGVDINNGDSANVGEIVGTKVFVGCSVSVNVGKMLRSCRLVSSATAGRQPTSTIPTSIRSAITACLWSIYFIGPPDPSDTLFSTQP